MNNSTKDGTRRDAASREAISETANSHAVTHLLLEWRAGDEEALERLTPIVYNELRRLARGQMRRRGSKAGMLQTTALVHEAYLRLAGQPADWQGREHFFAIAATVMRQVLVDDARRRTSQKRGGGARDLPLEDLDDQARIEAAPDVDLLALDAALEQLSTVDPRKARAVELRFFGGLKIAEIAGVLNISHATVERELRTAKAWLSQALDS
ncbi:MAG: sigma-70 family RNA polymerase sigma factor [Acidobacteriota bacterium]